MPENQKTSERVWLTYEEVEERTGTVAACVLVALGNHSADEAIGAVRAARKGTVQTREQEDFVRRFEATLREREGENT